MHRVCSKVFHALFPSETAGTRIDRFLDRVLCRNTAGKSHSSSSTYSSTSASEVDMDGSAGVQQTHRHAHRMPQPHEMPSGWPTSAAPLPPHCYGVPHPYSSYPAPFAGSFNHYPAPQVIYAPPPAWYYQNPPAQPSNSYVVYNGTTDNPHSGLKGQNSGGGGGKNQKGGEQRGHGDTGGADGDNAEGAKEDNAPSKKKGGGGMYFWFSSPVTIKRGILTYSSFENRPKETNTCASQLPLESYIAKPTL